MNVYAFKKGESIESVENTHSVSQQDEPENLWHVKYPQVISVEVPGCGGVAFPSYCPYAYKSVQVCQSAGGFLSNVSFFFLVGCHSLGSDLKAALLFFFFFFFV